MSSLPFSFLAAGCASLSSLFFRKNTDSGSVDRNACGYLVLFYLFSFLLSFVIYPTIWQSQINFILLGIGACVGILSSILMTFTSQALKQGPAGLTFAFQNASAVFPGLLLFLLFGKNFGFSISYLQIIGMIIVLLGLFLGAKKEKENASKTTFIWLKYAIACFLIQIVALTLIQARCLITLTDDAWFMLGQFGASTLIQIVIFWREKKRFQKQEIVYGCLGGLANFSSTCLLLLATKYAHPFEKGILFPCFAVGSMILCNLWANWLYKEKFNLITTVLCSAGIFLAVNLFGG